MTASHHHSPAFDQSLPAGAPDSQAPANDCGDQILLELRGISKRFGDNQVLDNIDLTVNRGEAVAIIGPSGTGKSTILRIIAGLLSPMLAKSTFRGSGGKG
jgi:phospholipid/cholesterol/gamma-HCH transport system ATP-binding protein